MHTKAREIKKSSMLRERTMMALVRPRVATAKHAAMNQNQVNVCTVGVLSSLMTSAHESKRLSSNIAPWSKVLYFLEERNMGERFNINLGRFVKHITQNNARRVGIPG